ncbi:MAG TPA: hypothetical protein VII29_04230, partial [Terriglobales bacterium]
MVDAYLPNTIGFAGPGFAEFAVLYLSTPLTNAGGIVPIALGYDCPPIGGCGALLLANSGHNPELIGVTPEPTAFVLFASGLARWDSGCAANWASQTWRFKKLAHLLRWSGCAFFCGSNVANNDKHESHLDSTGS